MHICSFFFWGCSFLLLLCMNTFPACCDFCADFSLSYLIEWWTKGATGWVGRCRGGCSWTTEQIYTRGQRRKSHDDFQLNGGNVTEINLHKYNMVRACWCHFICPIYRRTRMLCMHICMYISYMERARTNMFAQKCVLIYVMKLSFRLRFFFLFFQI